MCNCNKCRDCHKKAVSCDFVKDKICCHWTVPSGQAQTVYITAGINVFASGYVTYESGEEEYIYVNFFNNGDLIRQITISQGSCTTFTVANFTSILVECPNMGTTDECMGEICITPRYQVQCDENGFGG